jgi:hypothetical protein
VREKRVDAILSNAWKEEEDLAGWDGLQGRLLRRLDGQTVIGLSQLWFWD